MGSKFVLADPKRCVGCKACMAACLVKHFVKDDVPAARLNVVRVGEYTAPIVCHHCANAPCAASCPTGALYSDGDRIGVRLHRCIGCRSCVVACPYGAVDVVDRYDLNILGELTVGALPRAMVIKCDRCIDRLNGPACIEACTSSAIDIVDQDDIDNLQEKRRVACAAL